MRLAVVGIVLTVFGYVCSPLCKQSASGPTPSGDGIARSRALYAAERSRDLSPHTVFESLDPWVRSVDTVASSSIDGTVVMEYYSSGVPPSRRLVAVQVGEPLSGRGSATITFEGYYQACTRPGCALDDLEQDSLWMKMYYKARPEDSVWMKACVTEIFASVRTACLKTEAQRSR
jgi:hypothetical protein